MTLNFRSIAVALCIAASVCSCEKPDKPKPDDKGDDKVQDIEVVDGKVRFYLSFSEDAPRVKAGIKTARLTKVSVNSKDYTIGTDDQGRKYVDVAESGTKTYNAVYYNTLSKDYYGSSANMDVKLPYSQFQVETIGSLQDYPMYASYSSETGNKLIFKEGFAMVELDLKGDASITSVNVKNLSGSMIAGLCAFKPSQGKFSVTKGVSFVELNCTQGGSNTQLSESSAKRFFVLLAPGNYGKGLEITVCDASHRMMQFTTDPVTLGANETLLVTKDYKPADDLIFFEGFDTFVWGGDYVKGSAAPCFAPSADAIGIDSGKDLLGTEECLTSTVYDNPGSGFIQSNTWSDCQSNYNAPKTVATSHVLSDSYVKYRSISDYTYLFRTQERPGYVELGGATTSRGILQTPMFLNTPEICSVKIEMDVCLKSDFDDGLLIDVVNGGYIVGLTIDGRALDINSTEVARKYECAASETRIVNKNLTIYSNPASAKNWSHIEVSVDRATSGSMLYLSSVSSTSGHHGIFVDNIKVTKVQQMKRASNNLRVLYWNIQNGMWSDQANNYDNFVEFVKKYDPDVCIWCESVTIYKDNTKTGIGNSGSTYKGYLPNGWTALAARYGHKYMAVGGARDNYPQTVTSKYPITTLLKITNGETSSKPIAHGAGLHSITVSGKTIYVATLHTWPQAYGYGVSSANQSSSSDKHEGDYYREYEMDYVIKHTKNAATYSSQADWIFCGDFNSRSRKDNWYYNYAANDTKLLCQDVILNNTDYVDVIGQRYLGDFMSSTYGTGRIDYHYASPSMYARVHNAMVIIDDWTTAEADLKYGTSFINPSDHRPILVDYDMSK